MTEPTDDVRRRLERAEAVLAALREGQVDAVLGQGGVSLVRLREVEQALKLSVRLAHRRLEEIESIYASAPVGLCVLDRDLRYVRINDRLAEINGLPAAEHLGKTIHEVVPQLAEERGQQMEQAIATGQPRLGVQLHGETTAQPGMIRYWVEHWLPLRDSAGEVAGLNIVVEETTDRVRNEQALRKLNQTLEQRVAERTAEAEHRAAQLQRLALELSNAEDRERQRIGDVLHDDVQQLLAAMRYRLAKLDPARRGARADPGLIPEIRGLIDQAIQTCRDLSHELSPPTLRRNGLLAALRWLAEDVRDKHGLRVQLRLQPEAEPPSAAVASVLFRSVRELLFNVVKHAGQHRATIDAERSGEAIWITVADDGLGFDPAVLTQADQTPTGFGLFSIRERIHFLGGRTHIATRPGQGCRVCLSVPTDLPTDPPAPEADGIVTWSDGRADGDGQAASSDGTATRVLLVDDHDMVRRGLADLLDAEPDIELVGEAADGRQAVQMAERLRPDVILMDVTMPVMDGIEATGQITRHLPVTRVLALSMHDDPATAARMAEAGAAAYVCKSGPPEELLDAVRGVKQPDPSEA